MDPGEVKGHQTPAVDRFEAGPPPAIPPLPAARAARWLLPALGVFLTALAARLFFLRGLAGSPDFAIPIVDAATYQRLALALAFGKAPPPAELFWQPAFYPLFLAAVYKVFGVSLTLVRVLQAVLGSATCVGAWWLGEKVFDRRTGVIAGLACALYGPLLFHDTELLATPWSGFWSVTLVALLLHAERDRGRPAALAWGCAGAAALLTRPENTLFFLAGSIWLLVRLRRAGVPRADLARRGGVVAAGFLLLYLPLALLNHRVSQHFSAVPASGGINLYIGNNPDLCDTRNARPGFAYGQITNLPLRSGARDMWDSQGVYLREVLSYAVAQPAELLRGLGFKTLELLSSREIPRNTDIYLYREWSPLLRVLVWKIGSFGFPFGILLPLAAAGWVLNRRRVPWPLTAALALSALALVAVFPSARHRAPLIPLLAILGAAAVTSCAGQLRRGRGRPLLLAGAATFGAVALVAGAPGPFCTEKSIAAELYNAVGSEKYLLGRLPEAEVDLREALRLDASYAEAYLNLGMTLLALGRTQEGFENLFAAVRANQQFDLPYLSLGYASGSLGRTSDAVRYTREALRLNKFNPMAHNNLGAYLVRSGFEAEAIRHYEEAVRLNPEYAEPRNNLGNLALQRGDYEGARRHLEAALRLKPDYPDAQRNLARLPARAASGPSR